jgi:hypothetical protein
VDRSPTYTTSRDVTAADVDEACSSAGAPIPALRSRTSALTVVQVNILQIAPALHGAKMHTTAGAYPVVVWALIEDDDANRHVVGLSVGGKGDRALVPPDQDTFESYSQTG